MMRRFLLAILVLGVVSYCGCSGPVQKTVTQICTIDALLAGGYDGYITIGQLTRYGDFGIGTFDKLDGEMIVYEGRVYEVRADGKVYRPSDNIKTPFATICKFRPDKKITIVKEVNYQSLAAMADEAAGNENLFRAVKAEGVFKRIKARSVAAQKKPYLPLVEVTKNQSVFELENIKGILVGFKCPAYVKGINMPGYHFHFISEDCKHAGHVLDFEMDSGVCEIDICNRLELILPDDESFRAIDLSGDKSKELEKAER